ncbi:MAG: class I SAM-dependent methyltransferase [Anaerolineales bacterium]|nr:class I SAM-dependent methyltransferase [Anaerolineales bacterium]
MVVDNLTFKLSDVSDTLFLTLYSRVFESRSTDPLIDDPQAEAIAEKLTPILAQSDKKMLRKLAQGKLDSRLVVHIALRARKYDAYTRDFLAQHPDGIVVNMGCGLDTRFHRVDNGRFHLYDLDLPEVMAVKRQVLAETDRYHFIGQSVLDVAWVEMLKAEWGERPFLFLAEGLFMYLQPEPVKALILKLRETFTGAELVFEAVNERLTRPLMRRMVEFKMQKELGIGAGAGYYFGIKDGLEPESWHPGIKFLDEWVYFDEPEKKIGWMRSFRHLEMFRTTQWTVHYRLN